MITDRYFKLKRKQRGLELFIKNIMVMKVCLKAYSNLKEIKKYNQFQFNKPIMCVKYLFIWKMKMKKYQGRTKMDKL